MNPVDTVKSSLVCILCNKSLDKPSDKNLVEGKGIFKPLTEINILPFVVSASSPYICKQCLSLLKKRNALRSKLTELDSELKTKHEMIQESKRRTSDFELTSPTPPLKIRLISFPDGTTTRASEGPKSTEQQNPVDFVEGERMDHIDQPPVTKVFVEVAWPSETRKRELAPALHSLGKMLLRGTYKQIASAAWKCKDIRPYLISEMLKTINKECTSLCARKSPSLLRLVKRDDIVKFNFTDFNSELEERCPLLHASLKTACLKRSIVSKKTNLILENQEKSDRNDKWLQPLCMAAAICAKTRSSHLTALQLIISIILQHCSLTAAMARLRAVKLTVSHPCLHKKLDDFGALLDQATEQRVTKEGKGILTGRKEQQIEVNEILTPNSGWKITFDNIDYKSNVHHMSEHHQSPMYHWVTYMSTENRVPAFHLSSDKPQNNLESIEFGVFIPNQNEHKAQRKDYIYLVSRICSENIPCLRFLAPCLRKHMAHKYFDATMQATNTVFHGCIFENENDSDGILKVLNVLHTLVPRTETNDGKVFAEQGIVGDQLSVERGVNCLLEVSNGFTQEERFEGLHFEVGDFHATMKLLQVGFDNFYHGAASSDKCTLFADSILINRRNVGADVRSRYSACKQFFLLEVESRVVAGALQILQMSSLDDVPSERHLPKSLQEGTMNEKKMFLERLATAVVDCYILQLDKVADLVRKITAATKDSSQVSNNALFKCRHASCTKSFKTDGKARRDHEASHVSEAGKLKESDDIYNYQVALLEYGFLVKNFLDAISNGDGERVFRCWKFALLYLKADGRRSSKYALECMYLICQRYYLLSEQAAHRLVWNRFAKNKHGCGGNIPLDLALEHFNRILKNVLKMLGPNVANKKAVDRYCKALVTSKALIDQWDATTMFICRSGKHSATKDSTDLQKIVKELMDCGALRKTPGRKYKHQSIGSSLITDFNISELFKWISDHIKMVKQKKIAR